MTKDPAGTEAGQPGSPARPAPTATGPQALDDAALDGVTGGGMSNSTTIRGLGRFIDIIEDSLMQNGPPPQGG